MAKIYARNKEYNGISAGVRFCNGVGETDTPHIKEWFRNHDYTVEEDEREDCTEEPLEEAPGEEEPKKTPKKPQRKAGD